jgi:hypothetical protein
MKTFAALFALTLTGLPGQAQINFQPGYYIRNDGARTSCLIKDYGWLNNPTSIVCKNSPDDVPVTVGIDSIVEFGVSGAKYQRFEVDVETSSNAIDELSRSPIPAFRHEKALLRVLVEGRASLYLYTGRRLSRFFYRLNGQRPGPLVFKQYLGQDGIIHANQEFIKVLADSLSCSAPDLPDPTLVKYEANSLARFFIAYSTCEKSAYTDYFAKAVKTIFHLNIRPGADLANLVVRDISTYPATRYSYGYHPGFRIGAEAEMILPFARNKWAVLIEPEFRTFTSSPGAGYNLDYKALQVLLCGRYFLFISPQSKLYVTAGLFTNFDLGSTLEYETVGLVIEPRLGATAAAGFRYKDRFGIELQYQFPEQILDNYYYERANVTTASLVLSIKIL